MTPLRHNPYHTPRTRRDNSLYEFAAATTPAPLPDATDQPTPAGEAAWMLRQIMFLIADACICPVDAYYCVLRASGLSMAAIARRDGRKSRQAVQKRLIRVCRREPILQTYLCHDRRQCEISNARYGDLRGHSGHIRPDPTNHTTQPATTAKEAANA